jgi:uncharacterized membrane protein
MSELLALPLIGIGLVILSFPVLVLILLGATLSLRGRLRSLQARVDALERELAAARGTAPVAGEPTTHPTTPAAEPSPAAEAGPAPGIAVAPAEAEAPRAEAEPASAGPPSAGPLSPPACAPIPTPAPPEPAGVGQLEGRLGGTWLNRIGALVLVVGVGFFLKYAVESAWIGPGGRVAMGVVAGLGLLGLGERLRRAAYERPAQGITAAGIATLYLTVYAAHALYGLVAVAGAFAGLVLVTAIGTVLAVRDDARAVALLTILGGFLTPILLDTDTDAAGALFTYVAVLDAGMLATAYRRRWPEVAALAFALTQVLFWGWVDRWYEPPRLGVAFAGATVFFLLFALFGPGAAVGEGSRTGPLRRAGLARALVLAAPAAYYLSARHLLEPESTRVLALLCLGVAALYGVAGALLRRLDGDRPGWAGLHFAVALGFLTLAIAVRFSGTTVAIAWSGEAVALLAVGLGRGVRGLRLSALAVFALAWLRWAMLLEAPTIYDGRFLVDHPAFPVTAAVAAAGWIMAALYRRAGRDVAGREAVAGPLLVVAALCSAALLATDALNPQGPLRLPLAYQQALGTMVWTVAALPLLALARTDRTRVLLAATVLVLAGVGLPAVWGGAGGWASLPARLRPVGLNPRFLAGLLIVVVYGLFARLARDLPEISERARGRLAALGGGAAVLLLWWNLSAEIFLMPLDGLWAREADKVRQVGLSVLWTVYALAAMGVGLWRRRPALRQFAIALFGLTVAKVLLVDASALDALYRILSFLLLGAVLLLVSFLYARSRQRPAP